MPTKSELAEQGRDLVRRFCQVNNWAIPRMVEGVPGRGSCGLYEGKVIYVTTQACANCGYSGAAWSWPGYVIDRTPYGVHAHEFGHFVDEKLGFISRRLRRASGEPKLTNYCPNSSEWFAEMFRLFVTNPDLLKLVRPITYRLLCEEEFLVAEERTWDLVLASAPERTVAQARKKMVVAR